MSKLANKLRAWLRRIFKRQRPPIRLEEVVRFEPRQRHTQTYYSAKTACISIAEGLTPEHKKVLLEACGRQIIEKMIEEDALGFQVIPCEQLNDLMRRIEFRAAIEVVIPEKDEEVET